MRTAIFLLLCAFAVPAVPAADDDRSLAFSVGGFSGKDTGGIAIGFYSSRPKSIGWYINGTVSSRADEPDEIFRPIRGDIRIDSETESATLDTGLTLGLGRSAPYGARISQISDYGLYRTSSAAFWYEENDNTKANFNAGALLLLHRNFGLDIGANSANDEIVLGLKWVLSLGSIELRRFSGNLPLLPRLK